MYKYIQYTSMKTAGLLVILLNVVLDYFVFYSRYKTTGNANVTNRMWESFFPPF